MHSNDLSVTSLSAGRAVVVYDFRFRRKSDAGSRCSVLYMYGQWEILLCGQRGVMEPHQANLQSIYLASGTVAQTLDSTFRYACTRSGCLLSCAHVFVFNTSRKAQW